MNFGTRTRLAFLISLAVAPGLWAQGTLADYQRAQGLQRKARGLVVDSPGTAEWIGESEHFWYPRTVKGGTEFLLVDAAAGTKKPAFDHDKLAAAISAASRTQVYGTDSALCAASRPGRRRPGRGGRSAKPRR